MRLLALENSDHAVGEINVADARCLGALEHGADPRTLDPDRLAPPVDIAPPNGDLLARPETGAEGELVPVKNMLVVPVSDESNDGLHLLTLKRIGHRLLNFEVFDIEHGRPLHDLVVHSGRKNLAERDELVVDRFGRHALGEVRHGLLDLGMLDGGDVPLAERRFPDVAQCALVVAPGRLLDRQTGEPAVGIG
nr:hypothetical protein [Tardibacter chloracetimidivorans]